ncbi:MAG TPA: prepilin-type N-terminal cleavage/methylation domain-containing protein [Candidatus Omnitrophota bacterium]|nr:prepilin-type N-terminal cleavage/methylation domain-containing protein [Candidatus Omnitrophota bacterium]HRZ15772.1 prepilin-type N-terminal cleavage/methylation domain-containing protein [Candidatus Omnitrophota bacterium]
MRVRGFTLVELIVVIAIIAVLAAVIAPQAYRAVEKAKIAKAHTDYRAIHTATYALHGDTGDWPHGGNSRERVIWSGLMRNPPLWNAAGTLNVPYGGWNGPYLEKFSGMHPWGGIYMFSTNANFGRGTAGELAVEFENMCFPNGATSNCPVPLSSQLIIDRSLDDGVNNVGEVQRTSWNDLHWVIIWDKCAPGVVACENSSS